VQSAVEGCLVSSVFVLTFRYRSGHSLENGERREDLPRCGRRCVGCDAGTVSAGTHVTVSHAVAAPTNRWQVGAVHVSSFGRLWVCERPVLSCEGCSCEH
jgi:hypothetical protein